MAGYGQNKKKLRFKIRQMEFADVLGYFRSIPGAHTEYKLELSQNCFRRCAFPAIHNDCIAFSQLLRMKGVSYRDLREWDDFEQAYGELEEDFVTVSFAHVKWEQSVQVPPRSGNARSATRTLEFLAKELFLNGFFVRNGETGDTVRYVRFAASANMTRHGKVMYVKKEHEPELSRRVTLGLEENGCLEWAKGLIPAKWDAYKGLCLSDGYALAELKETNPAPGAPELSEAGVAFVQDMQWRHIAAAPCDAKPLCFPIDEKENSVTVGAPFVGGEQELRKAREHAVLTDGVGLISPDAAQWISKALCGDPKTVTTFQIRLPFVKGMVHRVDFRAYLAERGVTEIPDAWGNLRPVSSVWMVLPLSMFKADKWFAQEAVRIGRKEKSAPGLYFERLLKYGHDLVITQRHIPKTDDAQPFRLNYEVLQTCGMTQAEFDELLQENLKQYAMLRQDEETRFAWLTGEKKISDPSEESAEEEWDEDSVDADDAETDETGDNAPDDDSPKEEDDEEEAANHAVSADVRSVLAQAVRKNRSLLYSAKAKDLLNDACNALAFGKILRGNLTLPDGSQGESRYLSCDLGRYLDYLVSLGHGLKDSCFRPLSPGEFYAPGFRSAGAYCALFRTPHYSRNEHLLLRPLPDGADSSRERWFGHLRGVLMIPPEGFAAARLGGADFDGDHVSIVDDALYVGAVERALGLSGLDDEKRVRLGGSVLPFIMIPSAKTKRLYQYDATEENRRKLGYREFDAFRSSCDNRVGIFSNSAFSHGAAAYGAEPNESEAIIVQTLTALAGMEIDAAKTGIKPKIPEGAEKNKSGPFLYIKQGVKRSNNPRWSRPDNPEKKGLFFGESVGRA